MWAWKCPATLKHFKPCFQICATVPKRSLFWERLPPETTINWDFVIFNGLTIQGIYGREMYETWYKMTVMIQSGLNIQPIITHRYDFNDYEAAFQAMRSGQSGKVILNWFSD